MEITFSKIMKLAIVFLASFFVLIFFRSYRIEITRVNSNSIIVNHKVDRLPFYLDKVGENFKQMNNKENEAIYKNFYFENIRTLTIIDELINNITCFEYIVISEVEIDLYNTLSLLLNYMLTTENFYNISDNIVNFSNIFSDIVHYNNIYTETGVSDMLEISLETLLIFMFSNNTNIIPTFNPAFHAQIVKITQDYIVVEKLNIYDYINKIEFTNRFYYVYLKNKTTGEYVSLYDEFRRPIFVENLNEDDITMIVYERNFDDTILFNISPIRIKNVVNIQKLDKNHFDYENIGNIVEKKKKKNYFL
jgi:hypothetical protein